LALAQFAGAIGFGPSPDLATPHLLAEFELSINNEGVPGRTGGPGFYDPSKAFWSASVGGTSEGGPIPSSTISSGQFMLNPDGTTMVMPLFDTTGGPARQPQDVAGVVPEPAAMWLLLTGLSGLALVAGRRRRRAGRTKRESE